MNIRQATSSYETWMAHHLPVVRSDLRLKHSRMIESPFAFLRGTFYRWMQLWPSVCKKIADAPVVMAVGDLHLENFGTWRDIEGRLVWGVNDVDEACRLPYTNDLTRLAASALLAAREQHLRLTPRGACDAIVHGYRASLDRGGGPVVLAEHHQWLRQIALSDLRDPLSFWARLVAQRPATGRAPHAALKSLMPAPGLKYRVVHRIAGMGSLGRPRFVALASWGGTLIAREAKAVLPSAAGWASGKPSVADPAAVLRHAIRIPDPFFAVRGGWIVRRLAPDCTRIEIADIPQSRDEARLLRAMGWETANLHLGTRRAPVARDVAQRGSQWLERAARDMAEAVIQDWKEWRRTSPA
jgi:Uncharacterized protein conserved in bacteria (DUF2252)